MRMPRLIDANDLLMDNSWAFYDENGNRNDACIAVENAPTVDAIPIEWIKEWANNWCDWSQEQLIEVLLRTWNKKRMPIVDTVRHGYWIDEIGMLMCSECGDSWGTEMEEMVRSFNYCPNCGAKMETE